MLSEAQLPEGLEEIGYYAFYYCGIHNSEFKVTLPKSLKAIGESAFAYANIKTIVIPDGIKKLDRTFDSCSSLEQIDLGKVEELGGFTFYQCPALKNITLPNTLKKIDAGAFMMSAISEIIIPEGVTSLGEYDEESGHGMPAFMQCENLTKIVIPSTVTYVSEMEFGGCTNLQEIDYQGSQEDWDKLTQKLDPSNLPANIEIKHDYDYATGKTSIKGAKVILTANSFVYNGKQHSPGIKTIGGRVLTEGTDYTVGGTRASTNAGRYTIAIEGMGEYTGNTTATYEIRKADNMVAAKGKSAKLKSSKLKKKSQILMKEIA